MPARFAPGASAANSYPTRSAAPVEDRWLAYAESGERASVEDGATWIATSRYDGWPPIARLHVVPGYRVP